MASVLLCSVLFWVFFSLNSAIFDILGSSLMHVLCPFPSIIFSQFLFSLLSQFFLMPLTSTHHSVPGLSPVPFLIFAYTLVTSARLMTLKTVHQLLPRQGSPPDLPTHGVLIDNSIWILDRKLNPSVSQDVPQIIPTKYFLLCHPQYP